MLDKLYKEKIEKNVKISAAELQNEKKKIHKKLILNYIASNSREEINRIYSSLLHGEPFDSVLSKRNEAAKQTEGIPVYYGDMKPYLENAVFALRINEFTKPLKVDSLWVIYKLTETERVKTNPNFPNKSDDKIARETLFNRKAKKIFKEYNKKIVLGKRIKSDKILSDKLTTSLLAKLEDAENPFNEKKNKYELGYYSIIGIKKDFDKEELNAQFIKFKKEPVSLDFFINQLATEGFSTNDISRGSVEESLHAYTKRFIWETILEREALKAGYENSPDLKNDLKLWRESFLASYYRNSLLDSISVNDNEIEAVYNRVKEQIPGELKNKPDEVFDKITSALYNKKIKEFYEQKTIKLARKYGVKIYRDKLNEIKVTDIEMIAYRSLGFGGTITAVPYTIPFFEWKNWLNKKITNPLEDR